MDCRPKTPAPNAYRTEDEVASRGPSFSMSGRVRTSQDLKDNLTKVGPQSYKAEQYIDYNNPSFTMSGRTRMPRTIDTTPGAAAYDPQSKFTFQGRPKMNTQKYQESVPAPGYYDVTKNEQFGPSFTISGRTKTADDLKTELLTKVGPTSYNVENYKDYADPKFTISGRPKILKQQDTTPGPAKYYAEDEKDPHHGCQFTMSGRVPYNNAINWRK